MSVIEELLGRALSSVKPPSMLRKDGRFPDCAKLLRDATRDQLQTVPMAETFVSLCRVTLVAWVVWAINFACFVICVLLFLSLWATATRDTNVPLIFGLTVKMIIAGLAAVVFLLSMAYQGLLTTVESVSKDFELLCSSRLDDSGQGDTVMTDSPESPGGAFVGVSLDGKQFSRRWVRGALRYMLAEHSRVLLLLADDLFLYTRSSRQHADAIVLDVASACATAAIRTDEFERFLRSEIDRLDESDRGRIRIKRWKDFADNKYVDVLRRLRIAFDTIDVFRESVEQGANLHTMARASGKRIPRMGETSISYVLDELAMCLRITELEGYHNEYYPRPELPVLTRLYASEFEAQGLSIRTLVGQDPRRSFQCITID